MPFALDDLDSNCQGSQHGLRIQRRRHTFVNMLGEDMVPRRETDPRTSGGACSQGLQEYLSERLGQR